MKFELGPGMKCDLAILVERRMLIQASSGGGKSRTIRRIAEQTHGKIPQIIIDPEGELVSLREQFDYVLVAASGGDAQAHPRTAALLAERLLDLGVSAILDLYELKRKPQVEFITAFFTALMEIPKRLWSPRLIIMDEAQLFAPEGVKCESTAAVIDVATRGRKRGHTLIAATQRIGMFDKNVAAVLHNKLIGFTSLDTDLKRAAFELGFDKEKMLGLRDLPPMRYWGFGPALTRVPTLVDIGPHVTTHPKHGQKLAIAVPPPTEKIRALLPQLADLPAEAEHKAKTEADLRKDLAAARATITRLERAAPVQTTAKVDPAIASELRQVTADVGRLQAHNTKLNQALERLMKFILEINAQDFFKAGGESIDKAAVQKAIDAAAAQLVKLAELDVGRRQAAFEKWRKQGEQMVARLTQLLGQDVKVTVAVKHNEPFTVSTPPVRPERQTRAQPPVDGEFRPSGPQRRILNALAWLETIGVEAGDKTQVAMLADQSPTSSSYSNNVSALRTAGLIDYPGLGTVRLTESGRAVADPAEVPSSSEQLHEILYRKLSAPQAAILRILIAIYPEEIGKTELAERAGASATSSSFANNLSALRSLKLIDYTPARGVVALPVLFLEGAA